MKTPTNLFGSFIIIREYSWISFSRSLETSIPSISHDQGKLFDISKYKLKKYENFRMGLDKNRVRGIHISKQESMTFFIYPGNGKHHVYHK